MAQRMRLTVLLPLPRRQAQETLRKIGSFRPRKSTADLGSLAQRLMIINDCNTVEVSQHVFSVMREKGEATLPMFPLAQMVQNPDRVIA